MRRVKTRERAVFKALANEVRRELLEHLAQGEQAVGDLARKVNTSPSLTSIHLRSLRRAGLVAARIDAKNRIYHLCPEGLAAARRFIEELEASPAAHSPVVAIEVREPEPVGV